MGLGAYGKFYVPQCNGYTIWQLSLYHLQDGSASFVLVQPMRALCKN